MSTQYLPSGDPHPLQLAVQEGDRRREEKRREERRREEESKTRRREEESEERRNDWGRRGPEQCIGSPPSLGNIKFSLKLLIWYTSSLYTEDMAGEKSY